MTLFVVADVLLAANVVSVVALVLAGLLAAPVRRERRPLARATASVIALAVAGGTALAARGIDRASVVGPGAGGLLGLGEAATALSLLTGFPEGLAVVVAVKALGRYPELRSPGVSERFIIGTLTSLLWVAACAGVGALLLGGPPDLLPGR